MTTILPTEVLDLARRISVWSTRREEWRDEDDAVIEEAEWIEGSTSSERLYASYRVCLRSSRSGALFVLEDYAIAVHENGRGRRIAEEEKGRVYEAIRRASGIL